MITERKPVPTPASLEKKLEKIPEEKTIDAVDITSPDLPLKNKPFDKLKQLTEATKTTFHLVWQCSETEGNETRKFFFKQNENIHSPISELEAVCASFYKLLAPHQTPDTFAVYEMKDGISIYRGVLSEIIPKFKTTSIKPLTRNDIQTDVIEKLLDEKKISYEILDEKDEQLHTLKNGLHQLINRLRRLESVRCEQKKQVEGIAEDDEDHYSIDEEKDEQTSNEEKQTAFQILDLNNKIRTQKKKIALFYQGIHTLYNITPRDWERFRVVKGQAYGLASSFIYEEADLHQNNLSKFGERIDFDMSIWPILYYFKDSVTVLPRMPTDTMFKVTARDITDFPDMKDAHPPYWPTSAISFLTETASTLAKKVDYKVSSNPYPLQATEVYSELKENPIFKHYTMVQFTKSILCNSEIYRNTAALHLREECNYNGTVVINKVVAHQQARIKEFTDVLITLPKFILFFERYGMSAKKELMDNLKKQNISFDPKKIEASFLAIQKKISLRKDQEKKVAEINVPQSGKLFENLKESTRISMQDYLTPGLFGLGGYNRTKPDVAVRVIKYCKEFLPAAGDDMTNLQGIFDLRTTLRAEYSAIKCEEEESNKATPGEMRRKLEILYKSINAHLQNFETKIVIALKQMDPGETQEAFKRMLEKFKAEHTRLAATIPVPVVSKP